MGVDGRKPAILRRRFFPLVTQTRELARFSRISSFLSEHLAPLSESQLDAFLWAGTSRPMRTSVAGLVLSQHLSSGDVFIFYGSGYFGCLLAVQDTRLRHGFYGVFTPWHRNIIRRSLNHGQTPARRLHLPESEGSGVPDAHQFHRSSRREPAKIPPAGITIGLKSAAAKIIA
jgi:hypothetical protein